MLCCCCASKNDDTKVPILHSDAEILEPDPGKKRDSINGHTIVQNGPDSTEMGDKVSKNSTETEGMAEIKSKPSDGGIEDISNVQPVIPLTIVDDETLEDHEEDMSELHRKESISLSKDEIESLYFKAEFACMDLGKDGKLCYSEFVRLLAGLGYHLGVPGAKKVWKDCGKYESSYMTLREYVDLMKNDDELEKATSSCRSVFAAFDWDSSGWASKSDIIKGLETVLGITVTPQLEQKIQAMDSNKDGCVYYGDYLKMQLKGFK
ncbi:hypothetical protein LOTGIDRAFT_235605 [Lottia gigantea]|uniref:EF-hand domain-containing protein n=1 Tax=Lottia gigantea TaxID=225164 RepID=V3ZNW7_LOTGI|nr:hypothetical protein LOTGIDRAFT_235605 [Lottia gigantea]ESO86007.1 hypothetical protein LOTGIDRAFT_235605 [Lottia gigantea]